MQRASEDFTRQLKGLGLTTAQITYFFPDRPLIISPNTVTFQMYDMAPRFPALHDYIDFWKREIEGALHSVQFVHRLLIGPTDWRSMRGTITIN